jgi:hypothetical protein
VDQSLIGSSAGPAGIFDDVMVQRVHQDEQHQAQRYDFQHPAVFKNVPPPTVHFNHPLRLTILSAGGRWIDEDGWGQSCVFAIDWWKTSCMCVAGQLDESRPILTMEKPFAALPRTEVVGLAMVSLIILAFMLSIGLS